MATNPTSFDKILDAINQNKKVVAIVLIRESPAAQRIVSQYNYNHYGANPTPKLEPLALKEAKLFIDLLTAVLTEELPKPPRFYVVENFNDTKFPYRVADNEQGGELAQFESRLFADAFCKQLNSAETN